MKISVALCTYNGQRFLHNQLDSIVQQTRPVDEIIVCDDSSTDDTITILQQYQKKYPGLIHIEVNEPGLGAKNNFQKGISLCSGDVIFLSDQDDIWRQDKTEKLISRFLMYPHLEAVFSNGQLIDDGGQPIGGTLFSRFYFDQKHQTAWRTQGIFRHMTSEMNRITGATLAIRKSLALRSFPYQLPTFLWHDLWLGLNAAVNNNLDWIDEPLIQYRLHTGQQVGIGSGTTIAKEETDGSLRSLLHTWQQTEQNWLFTIEALLNKYNTPELKQIQQRKKQLIGFYDRRLHLSPNPVRRAFAVLLDTPLYIQQVKPVRSLLRDIVKPA